jgi:hypothetical protein
MCAGNRTICGPADLESPHVNRPGIDVQRGFTEEGAVFLDIHAQRQAPHPALTRGSERDQNHDRERRLELLIRRLPQWLQSPVRWLRKPAAWWLRIPAGLLLLAGGVFSILPVLGLWMLPLGLVLLAEDLPPLRRGTDAVLAWIERRRPHWMGLSRAPSPPSRMS